MNYLQSISSYLNFSAPGGQITRAVAGVGVAGLAVVSMKIVVAGALVYSAYKGGQYLHSRFFQRHEVRRDSGAGVRLAEMAEEHPELPIHAGHDSHNDQQEERREPPPRMNNPVDDLRRMQAGYKSRSAKNTFEILISHPDIQRKGNNMQWVRKMIKKHGRWSKATGGLSLYAVKAFRKIKACLPKKNPDEQPH